jgi:hypothetical protein
MLGRGLTLDDVIHDGDQVLLRLGEPPSPVPGPIADLLLNWIGNRDNMNTATNRNPRWLFSHLRSPSGWTTQRTHDS